MVPILHTVLQMMHVCLQWIGAKLLKNPHIIEYKSYAVKSNMFHSIREWLDQIFMACGMHKVKLRLSSGSF